MVLILLIIQVFHISILILIQTIQTRIMYYNKVVLGNESVLQVLDKDLVSAPKGYHSTHGQFAANTNADEYIVYRYGQHYHI